MVPCGFPISCRSSSIIPCWETDAVAGAPRREISAAASNAAHSSGSRRSVPVRNYLIVMEAERLTELRASGSKYVWVIPGSSRASPSGY